MRFILLGFFFRGIVFKVFSSVRKVGLVGFGCGVEVISFFIFMLWFVLEKVFFFIGESWFRLNIKNF